MTAPWLTARLVLLGLVAGTFWSGAWLPAHAEEERLGGGSDLPVGAVIELPGGGSLAPLHHVFADNPGARPIRVVFRAESPSGIDVVPERRGFTIPPGGSVKDRFGIRVADVVPPGNHRVTVQLVRSDIAPRPGQVTNIPAVGTTFVVRVVGEAATIEVRAVSAQSGRPVDGTLALAALNNPARPIEVARGDGTRLSTRVAPGRYRAAYLLAGRELASGAVRVAAAERAEIVLRVETVSFVRVAANPVEEGGKVVVAELVASVQNNLRPLPGKVIVRALVQHDDEPPTPVVLEQLDELPEGVTEAKLTYRPGQGFAPGSYRFVFELAVPEFTIAATERPMFRVSRPVPGLPVVAGLVAVAALAALIWAILRRRRTRDDSGSLVGATGRDGHT